MGPPWTGGAQVLGAVFASKIQQSFLDSSSLPQKRQECPGAFKESKMIIQVLLPSLQCLTHRFVLEKSGSGAGCMQSLDLPQAASYGPWGPWVVWTIGPLLEISNLKEAKYEKKGRMRVGMRSVVMRVWTRSVVMDKIFCQTRRIRGQSFASCLHNSQYKWVPTLPWNQVTNLTCCRA